MGKAASASRLNSADPFWFTRQATREQTWRRRATCRSRRRGQQILGSDAGLFRRDATIGTYCHEGIPLGVAGGVTGGLRCVVVCECTINLRQVLRLLSVYHLKSIDAAIPFTIAIVGGVSQAIGDIRLPFASR
jgi:hypothetical protein